MRTRCSHSWRGRIIVRDGPPESDFARCPAAAKIAGIAHSRAFYRVKLCDGPIPLRLIASAVRNRHQARCSLMGLAMDHVSTARTAGRMSGAQDDPVGYMPHE